MSKTLLFVDDEKQILKAIRRLFLDADYTIYTAESGEEALQILDDISIDLIVVDMRMQAMDGYELLQRVKQKYPSTVRLILSGYAEEKLIISALQNNLARIYLFKPWENKSLVRTIEQAIETEELLHSERISNSMRLIKDYLIEKNCYDEKLFLYEQCGDMHKLIQRMSKSRTQQSRILKILNASFCDVCINSIDEAIDRFGEFNIKNIALMEMLFECIRKLNPNGRIELEMEHDVLSNRITDLVYRRLLNKDLSEMNAVAGLLHRVGRYMHFDMQYALSDGSRGIEASYQELSGFILSMNELPYPVIEAALFHHSPKDSRIINKEIVAVVHLADYYAGVLLGGRQDRAVDEAVFEYLGFSKNDLENIIIPDIRQKWNLQFINKGNTMVWGENK